MLALYVQERTPDKGEWQRRADSHHAELWTRTLGKDFDLSKLSRREWDRFRRRRRTGAIDARGRDVPELASCPTCEGEGKRDCDPCDGTGRIRSRRAVGPRTVEKDCR